MGHSLSLIQGVVLPGTSVVGKESELRKTQSLVDSPGLFFEEDEIPTPSDPGRDYTKEGEPERGDNLHLS